LQPYYYAIKGKRKDGFTYVLYVNGGHPPWSLVDYMSHCCGYVCATLNPWFLARCRIFWISVSDEFLSQISMQKLE
jgi:hypothetical protein